MTKIGILDNRPTFTGVLDHLKKLNFVPNTVIDIGAAYGTKPLYQSFPDSFHVIIEPLNEFREILERETENLKKLILIGYAVSDQTGHDNINVHPDLVGSSLYNEVEHTEVNGFPRQIKLITLDNLYHNNNLKGPFLIKIDVQGAELDVINGSINTLAHTEVVIIEVSFFKFFENGPLVNDVIREMQKIGFVPYDIFNLQYRLLDNALAQADFVFVKKDGIFRKFHSYSNSEQRKIADKKRIKKISKIINVN